jgi:hypothetical protein
LQFRGFRRQGITYEVSRFRSIEGDLRVAGLALVELVGNIDGLTFSDVEVVACTEHAVAIRWPAPEGEHRAWVWAGAIRSR